MTEKFYTKNKIPIPAVTKEIRIEIELKILICQNFDTASHGIHLVLHQKLIQLKSFNNK